MKKRVLSLILAAVMVCGLLPTAALAADSDFVIENGVLKEYNGPGGDVVIPDGVTRIEDFAFNGLWEGSPVTSVVIPDGVTSIGECAFQGCIHMTSVTIPDSVTYIGDLAFNLMALKHITIGEYPNQYPGVEELSGVLTDVYYGGTQAQWEKIHIGETNQNDGLSKATIHYSAYAPLPTVQVNGRLITEVVPRTYDEVRDFIDGFAKVKLDNKWGLVDATGREVVPCKYSGIGGDLDAFFSEGLAKVNLDGKCGFIDKTGREVISCKYDGAGYFDQGLAAVKLDGKWGVIDKTGKEVVPCKYDEVRGFHEGLAAVRIGDWNTGKWGFIDKTGKEVVPCKYGDVGYDGFSNGLAAVGLDTGKKDEWDGPLYKWGFVDKTGKEVIPCRYDYAYSFSENGFALVCMDCDSFACGGKRGIIDKTGREVLPCTYGDVNNFSEGLAVVNVGGSVNQVGTAGGKWGFVDTANKEVVPCKYDWVQDFDQGLAAVALDTGERDEYGSYIYNWGLIDKTGREIVPCKYTEMWNFDQGLARVERDGKWGFIDATGKEVIPCKYDSVEEWNDGLARVCLNGKGWGLIDKTGKEVVPYKYNWVDNFSEGLARVTLDSGEKSKWGGTVYKYGFIDKTGKEVIPCQYTNAQDFSDGLAAVELNGKWGFIDATGAEVVPCQNEAAGSFHEGLAAVKARSGWGFILVYPSMTATPQTPTAYASTQTVQVDGKPVTFNAYALKDANGNDTNYIKLRDVADVLNGSAAQFQVGWDGTIAITTGQMYTPNGSENIQNFQGNQSYTVSTSPVTINGKTANLEAITLTDASGGGYTYFKLRDLGQALGFNVSWSAQTGITIDPNTPYNPNN